MGAAYSNICIRLQQIAAAVACPSKLVSYRNNRNWNRNQFRHYPKQDVCFGCFALISKQGVLVFQNNRKKQKTNRNSRKFVKISIFLIPHTMSSVCFGCFDTGLKHRNKPKKNFWPWRKNKPKNNRNRLSFGLFRIKPRKKLTVSRTPLIENVFWRFFWFVLVCFDKVLFVSVVSIQVRNTESNRNKPKKMFFGFAKQTEKQPKQTEFRFVLVRTEKKFDCFEDTLSCSQAPMSNKKRKYTKKDSGREGRVRTYTIRTSMIRTVEDLTLIRAAGGIYDFRNF